MSTADKKADEALAGIEQGAKGGNDTTAPSMGDKASDASETAKDKAGSAWESTKQGTSDSADATKEKTGSAWESTKQGTSDAAEATKEKATQAKDESASVLQTVRQSFILFCICVEYLSSELERSTQH